VVRGALTGALLAVDEGTGDARGQHEVDLQAAVALEALPVSVRARTAVRASRRVDVQAFRSWTRVANPHRPGSYACLPWTFRDEGLWLSPARVATLE